MEYHIKRWDRPERPNASELTAAMKSEGYSVFQWSDAAGTVYADHDHGEDQSHWIISGTLELNVNGFGTVVLSAGDRDFMPAGRVHSARVPGDEPVVYLIGAKSD